MGPGDPEDPDRLRNESRWAPPPVVPPEVPQRPDGMPPSPQGAGGRSHLEDHADWSGAARADGATPDPVLDARAKEQSAGALDAARPQLLACLRLLSTLRGRREAVLTATIERESADPGRGFVSLIVVDGVPEPPPEAEQCLAAAVADLDVGAPSGPPLSVSLRVQL